MYLIDLECDNFVHSGKSVDNAASDIGNASNKHSFITKGRVYRLTTQIYYIYTENENVRVSDVMYGRKLLS